MHEVATRPCRDRCCICTGAGRTSGFWGQSGGASGRDHMYNGAAAAQQAAAAAAAQHQRPPGQWQQPLPQQVHTAYFVHHCCMAAASAFEVCDVCVQALSVL